MKLTPRQVNLLKHTYIDYQQTSEFLDQPLIVDKADGVYYWDIEGKRYFDAIGGVFLAGVRDRPPRLPDAGHRPKGENKVAPAPHGLPAGTRGFLSQTCGA